MSELALMATDIVNAKRDGNVSLDKERTIKRGSIFVNSVSITMILYRWEFNSFQFIHYRFRPLHESRRVLGFRI